MKDTHSFIFIILVYIQCPFFIFNFEISCLQSFEFFYFLTEFICLILQFFYHINSMMMIFCLFLQVLESMFDWFVSDCCFFVLLMQDHIGKFQSYSIKWIFILSMHFISYWVPFLLQATLIEVEQFYLLWKIHLRLRFDMDFCGE